MEEDIYYSIELNYYGIRLIYTSLKQAVEKWSGGDPAEHKNLIEMRDNFYKLLLEYQFQHMN